MQTCTYLKSTNVELGDDSVGKVPYTGPELNSETWCGGKYLIPGAGVQREPKAW